MALMIGIPTQRRFVLDAMIVIKANELGIWELWALVVAMSFNFRGNIVEG